MIEQQTTHICRRNGEGPTLAVMGELVTLKLTGEETGGAFALVEQVTRPLSAPCSPSTASGRSNPRTETPSPPPEELLLAMEIVAMYIISMASLSDTNRFPFRVDPSFRDAFPDADLQATECVINLLLTDVILMGPHSRRLRPYRLSLGTLNLLQVLEGADAPLAPSELAERMKVTRGTITKLVDSLERQGRVRRGPHPHDRRMLLIEITDAGCAVLADLMPHLTRDEREWMSCLDTKEKETLVRLLGKIQGHIFAPITAEQAEAVDAMSG